jgi:hypothetical protein
MYLHAFPPMRAPTPPKASKPAHSARHGTASAHRAHSRRTPCSSCKSRPASDAGPTPSGSRPGVSGAMGNASILAAPAGRRLPVREKRGQYAPSDYAEHQYDHALLNRVGLRGTAIGRSAPQYAFCLIDQNPIARSLTLPLPLPLGAAWWAGAGGRGGRGDMQAMLPLFLSHTAGCTPASQPPRWAIATFISVCRPFAESLGPAPMSFHV